MNDGYKEVRIGPKKQYIPKEWDINSLSDIATFINGKGFSSKDWCDSGLPIVRIQNLNDINAEYNYYDGKVKSRYYLENGDILLSWSASLGTYKWNRGKAILNQHIFKVEPKNIINKEYLYQALKRNVRKLIKKTHGSTMKHIRKKELDLTYLPLPPLPEQKKIATILSTVDQALEKTTMIIDKTKRLKKGLMQRLLTKGVGHNEFKEVKIGPKTIQIPKQWDLNSIDSLSKEFISGGTPSTKNEDYWKGNIHWITGANIRDIKVNKGKDYITEKGLKNSNTKIVPANNIIIATRTTVGNIGINVIDIAISQDVTGIILDKQIVDVNFFVWSMKNLRYLLRVYQQGSTIKGITRNVLKRFQIPLPPLPEQKQIAAILTSVDNKIQKEQEYKQQLQQLKKGLMQQLLTGRRRVQV